MISTAYAYDPIEQKHSFDGHPEHRGRLHRTLQVLRDDSILERLEALTVTPISQERLNAVHTSSYIKRVALMDQVGGGFLDPDTYVVPGTYQAALASAGAMVGLVEAIMQGEIKRGMSLMRPPGHHALADRGMGFCIFANVVLAARLAREELGAERVLIFDWDVHHGNGTEALVGADPTIAYISTHQYPFYPGTGAKTDVGRGPGKGSVLNIPFPAGVGDKGYLQAFEELIVPFARRFHPDLILVSAGYDAHWRDPLAMEQLTLAGFAELARRTIQLADDLCQGRLAITLEGGYELDVLAYGILNTLRLLENPQATTTDPFGPAPHPEPDIQALIQNLRTLHQLP